MSKERELLLKKEKMERLKQKVKKVRKLIHVYKKMKYKLNDSFYNLTRVNPRKITDPKKYSVYLNSFVNRYRYPDNNYNYNYNNGNGNNLRALLRRFGR
jgi:hypothetical protein